MTGHMHPLPSNICRIEGHMSSAMYHAPSLIIGSLESIERVRAPQFLPSSRCDALARSKYAMRSRSEKSYVREAHIKVQLSLTFFRRPNTI